MSNEQYTWQITYKDGSQICEDEHQASFTELSLENVVKLALLPTGVGAYHQVQVPVGAMPIFFRRRCVECSPTGERLSMRTAHCIGYRCGAKAVYLFLLPDGQSVLSEDVQAV